MSPKTPVLSGQQMVAFLSNFEFSTMGQKGSYRKMRHADGRTVIIPMHHELAPGTLRSILRQADLSIDTLLHWIQRERMALMLSIVE